MVVCAGANACPATRSERQHVRVASRLRPLSMPVILIAVVALLCTACGSEEGLSVDAKSFNSEPDVAVAAWFLTGDRLFQVENPENERQLVDAGAPLFTLEAAAVPGHDGSTMFYNSWDWVRSPQKGVSLQDQYSPEEPAARPRVRVIDLATGSDNVIADGAHGIALSHEGMFATVVGVRPDYYVRFDREDFSRPKYPGHIVVSAAPGQPGKPWTTEPADYQVFAWAGEHLVAGRLIPGTEGVHDLLVFDGPGVVRTVAETMGFLAISPDGSKLLAGTLFERLADGTIAQLEQVEFTVLDVETGREISTVDLVRLERHGLGGLSAVFDATWTSQGIALAAQGVPENWDAQEDQASGPATMLVMSASSDSIAVDDVFVLPEDIAVTVSDVFFEKGGSVAAQIYSGDTSPDPVGTGERIIRCKIGEKSCTVLDRDGVEVTGDSGTRLLMRRVKNPSRPIVEPARDANLVGEELL